MRSTTLIEDASGDIKNSRHKILLHFADDLTAEIKYSLSATNLVLNPLVPDVHQKVTHT